MENKKPQKLIKVLQITGGFNKGVSGGIAAFLYNYYTAIDKSYIAFDFLTIGYQAFEPYREELEKMGGNLYCLDVHNAKGIKGKLTYTKRLSNFLKKHRYDIIHINVGSFYTVLLCSLVAKKKGRGAKVISHSHSTLPYQGIRNLSIKISKPTFKYVTDYFLACSLSAGKYMFPSKIIDSGRFMVMNNAIETERFLFDIETRGKYRKLLGVDDDLLVGHVGRFAEAKNHPFVIDIFYALHKKNRNTKLILVGAGPCEDEIREKVNSLKLEDAVIFAGQRRDVHKIMQAMDVFILPSLFEGLPVTSIEAQAAGLPVIVSDRVTLEAKLTSLYNQVPLNAGAEKWAEIIVDVHKKHKRQDMWAKIIESGYDIGDSVSKLENIYNMLMKKQ